MGCLKVSWLVVLMVMKSVVRLAVSKGETMVVKLDVLMVGKTENG